MDKDASKVSDPPPFEENQAEFPPLPKRKQRPQILAVKTTSPKMRGKTKESKLLDCDGSIKNKTLQEDSSGINQASTPTKRKIGATKRPKENCTERGNNALLDADASSDLSSRLQAESSVKRSKLMCYRDPPMLKSLDSETFNFLSASESFLSDGEQSTPTISPSTSTPAYENNNLGSLTDFIQQYSGTSLNSLPIDYDSPSHEVCSVKPNSNAISPLALPSSSSAVSVRAEPSLVTTSQGQCDKSCSSNLVPNPDLNKTPTGISKATSKSQTVLPLKSSTPTFNPLNSSKDLSGNLSTSVNDKRRDSQSHICDCADDHYLSTPVVGLFEAGHLMDIKNRTCSKNPGHHAFHLPSGLKVKDLPPDIQHEDSVTFFNCLSQLVVRISVERTSDKRPPDDPYRNYIGTTARRNGSGFIGHVDERIMKIKCRRDGCCGTDDPDARFNSSSSLEDIQSPPPVDRSLSNISTASSSSSNSSNDSSGSHYFYGGVYINTNKHVIFDKSEADFAHVHFFYNTPDKKGVIHGHVASIIGVSPNQDRVTLHVMSHDRNLFNLVNLHLKNASSSYKQMVQSTHMSQQFHAYGKEHSWAVIISHPHGMAKHITCGRVRSETVEPNCVVKYYDAATCPGSSGGLVTTPSLLHLQWPGAVHSCSDATTGLNVTFDSRFPDLNSKLISRFNKPLLGRKDSLPDNIFSL
ncbi:hypothetical protein ElyMa_001339600 [Elysia marginata]|uniref:Peptidase S1 domain-containing protein n=1 Tax=Elysia marginata TaxID=1093978 RepID=A0AAV4IN44_9GAST|nr:hypothetical protein ElyMa_001339600 [Elysia marginata]